MQTKERLIGGWHTRLDRSELRSLANLVSFWEKIMPNRAVLQQESDLPDSLERQENPCASSRHHEEPDVAKATVTRILLLAEWSEYEFAAVLVRANALAHQLAGVKQKPFDDWQ